MFRNRSDYNDGNKQQQDYHPISWSENKEIIASVWSTLSNKICVYQKYDPSDQLQLLLKFAVPFDHECDQRCLRCFQSNLNQENTIFIIILW
jgi:nuclear transport factor 2 (NTF2) superfamily protein